MLTWILTRRAGQALSALVAGALAIFGIYIKGRSDARAKAEAKTAKDYIDTRRRIDAADDIGNDPAVLREWLKRRGDAE